MTIGEKAKEVAAEFNTPRALRYGFEKGAEWMLEKAFKWLQGHVNEYLFDDGTPGRAWLKCKSDMFDDFRKAMKEE